MNIRRYIDRAVCKEIRKFLDDPKQKIMSQVKKICNSLSSAFYDGHRDVGYAKTAWDNDPELKKAEKTIDRVPDAVRNGNIERANSLLRSVFASCKSADFLDAHVVGGGSVSQALKKLQNLISSLKTI